MTSRNHNFPTDGIECRICSDSGLYLWQNEWRVCKAPHTQGRREQLQREADGANAAMRKLEGVRK